MLTEKYVVTTFKFGHGGTPTHSFCTYDKAFAHYESEIDEKWNSVEMIHFIGGVSKPVWRFICTEEAEALLNRHKKKF